MSCPPLHLETDAAKTRRQAVLDTALAVVPITNGSTADRTLYAMPSHVTNAEAFVVDFFVNNMDATNPQRHHALSGCWSHDYIAWRVDHGIWDMAYSHSHLTKEQSTAAFHTLFPEPEKSVYPFDTWLSRAVEYPIARRITRGDMTWAMAVSQSASSSMEVVPRNRELLAEARSNQHIQNTPADLGECMASQASEKHGAVESEKVDFIWASTWLTTIDIIPQGQFGKGLLEGVLVATLMGNKCWALLEPVIAIGQPDPWFCLGGLRSSTLVKVQDGYQCHCAAAQCIQFSAQDRGTRRLQFRKVAKNA
ncbi:hypothetical protein PG997_005656 [Apiospora hydei]|uniref:Uncharacterized protein n=1 Tax=Apiospora hydei TaxID=1337664 RepID=A0ABR1WLF7_9PEZI